MQALKDFGVLFGESWQIYKSRFWTLMGLSISPYLLGALVFLFGLDQGLFVGIYLLEPLSLAVCGILVIVGIAVAWLFGFAMNYAIKDGFDMADALKAAALNFRSLSWIAALLMLVILGGFMMGWVPGIIFGTWFSLARYIYIFEGDKGFSALLKSKEYIRGNWWGVFGRMFLLNLMIMPVSFAVGMASSFAMYPLITTGVMTDPILISIVPRIPQYLIGVITWPFILIYLFSIYKNFTLLKPELIGKKIDGPKGFWIFSAILGVVLPAIVGLFFYGIFYFMSSFNNSYRNYAPSYNQYDSYQNYNNPYDYYNDNPTNNGTILPRTYQ